MPGRYDRFKSLDEMALGEKTGKHKGQGDQDQTGHDKDQERFAPMLGIEGGFFAEHQPSRKKRERDQEKHECFKCNADHAAYSLS